MKKMILLSMVLLAGLTTRAQLQNLSFENWNNTNADYPVPENWTINQGMGQFGIFRDSMPQEGTFAMTLSRWYYYTFDDAVQTAATTTKPVELSGFYRYTDNNISWGSGEVKDTAHVYIYAKKWNAITQQNDTIGRGHTKLLGSDFWATFTCPVYYTTNDLPDSITIRLAPTEYNFVSGNGMCNTNGNGWCSYFTVDNLVLSETATGIDETAKTFSVFPNPANDRLYVGSMLKATTFNYTIVDVMGKTIKAENSHAVGIPLDISTLNNGVYFVTIQAGNATATQKIIKQ